LELRYKILFLWSEKPLKKSPDPAGRQEINLRSCENEHFSPFGKGSEILEISGNNSGKNGEKIRV